MAIKYDFDGVKRICSSGSSIDNSLDTLQSDLKKLRMLVNECENYYHGQGKHCLAFDAYEQIYGLIGSTSSYNVWYNFGMWDAISKIQNMTMQLKSNADRDKEEYEEEQRRLEEEAASQFNDIPDSWDNSYWTW